MNGADWLETFLAVVDRGVFTAASEQIHRSQSRVSAHIAALERQLGVRLLDRTRRPATPTPAGEVFARQVESAEVGFSSLVVLEQLTNIHGVRYWDNGFKRLTAGVTPWT